MIRPAKIFGLLSPVISQSRLTKVLNRVFFSITPSTLIRLKETVCVDGSPVVRNKKNIVVFDIDDTFCNYTYDEMKYEDPESERVTLRLRYEQNVQLYKFPPYQHILFFYLIKCEARIAFFSAGEEFRNKSLIARRLPQIFKPDELNELLSKGQFEVFSRHHCSDDMKDLKKVLKKDNEETMDDIILIDDCCGYVLDDQWPYINPHFDTLNRSDSTDVDFRDKDSTYFLLGLFKTYFESEEFKSKSLRVSMTQLMAELGEAVRKRYHLPETPFSIKMIQLGVQEVRKSFPEAVIYGTSMYMDKQDLYQVSEESLHHTVEDVMAVLDSIISGERRPAEPTIFVFMRYMIERGVQYFAGNKEVLDKFTQVQNMYEQQDYHGEKKK